MNLLEESFARLEEVKERVRAGTAEADLVDELIDEAMKRIQAEVDALAFEAAELSKATEPPARPEQHCELCHAPSEGPLCRWHVLFGDSEPSRWERT